MNDLTSHSEVRRIKPDGTNYAVAAGATAVTSEAIDTAGFDDIVLALGLGAIVAGAATSVKVQQSDTSGGTYDDLAGTSQTIADTDDNKVFLIQIHSPRERFLKVVTSRATQNATVDFLLAIMGTARKQPVTQGTTVGGTERFSSPAEGTA